MEIRLANEQDHNEIWTIFQSVIQSGDTYVYNPNTSYESFKKLWLAHYTSTYVAIENNKIVGTYILKPNQIDLGSHIANGSYMVLPSHQGKGIGEKMCEHSIHHAKELGYLAMQFNIVVTTNKAAISIWENYGFETIGIIPKAFKHSSLGFVDTLIMYKSLEE